MTPEIEKRIKAVQAGRVPAGYKRTPIGVIPKEWNMTSLKDVANHVIEKNKNNAVHLTLTNSATKGVIKQEDYFDKQISNNENTDGYYLVKDGDFIYNPRISESAPCGPINRSHIGEIGIASPLYTVFRLKENVQNVDYIELYLKSPFWHRYMSGVANYGARHDRMNITNDDLFAMPLPIPPLSEQKKIAEILATQDRVIELKEKLIAEKQSQKKYLMSVLLGDDFKKPFKLNGVIIDKKKWEKSTIGKISDISTGNKDTQNKKDNGKYPFYVRSPNPEKIDTYSYDGEAILTAGDGVGVGKVIHYVTGKFDFHQRVYKISDFDNHKAWGRFVYFYFLEHFYNRVKRMSAKNSVDSVRYNMISEMPLNLPALPEQKAIAEVLSAADEEISLCKKTWNKKSSRKSP